MIVVPTEPWAWTKRRWLLTGAAILAGQIGLIFWLSEPEQDALARAWAQGIVLAPARSGAPQGLPDPTIFVLPNQHGFSGQAWVNGQPLEPVSLEWKEPPRWLTQDVARLGNDFWRHAPIKTTVAVELPTQRELEVIPLTTDFLAGLSPTQTTLRIEGELAGRRLARPMALTPQAAPEDNTVLASSKVAVAVRPDGTVFSAKLDRSCGFKGADDEAVRAARAARFEPQAARAGRNDASLSWGSMIFEWFTRAPVTNSTTPIP